MILQSHSSDQENSRKVTLNKILKVNLNLNQSRDPNLNQNQSLLCSSVKRKVCKYSKFRKLPHLDKNKEKNQKKKEARDQDKNMVLLLRNFLMTYIDKDKRLLQLISIRSIVLRLRNN